MKRMWLVALTGVLAISTTAVTIDAASAVIRGGVYRGGVHRVGVGRVGIGYGRAGLGYGRARLAYGGRWNGYYRRGLGVAAGVALGAAAAGTYYGGYSDYGQDAYASAAGMSPALGSDNASSYFGYASRGGYGSGYISPSYYGPICNPRTDIHCQ